MRQTAFFSATIRDKVLRFARESMHEPVRIDAVVRTRKIGHFFPAGTVDGYDVWLEFRARDAAGKVLAWSGYVDDGGHGPVEKGAHFYRSYQIDGEGFHAADGTLLLREG